MIAKKKIERKIEGEYETIKYHRLKIPKANQVDFDLIADKLCFDDSYEAYFRFGISYGFDDCIWLVEVSKFIDNIRAYLAHEDSDWLADEDKWFILSELKKLEPYRGYDIYI